MTFTDATALGRQTLQMVLLVSSPVLLAALVVGSLVSVIQAVTQVHEATLTFLPKLLAVAAAFAIAGGWMMEQTVGFAQQSFSHIATAGQ
jgi:flagellar biosynthetic protein FliQ